MTFHVAKGIQGDTLDAIAYRFYGSSAVSMLPALLDANPDITTVILDEHQLVNLPVVTQALPSQTLKLWD